MMKFFRYKQVCRLNFNGIDDDLNDVQSVIITQNLNYLIMMK